jgi:Uma2 family endonuclease
MRKIAIKITPADHGKRMGLDDFDQAEVQEGYLYELSRGNITVTGKSGIQHLRQVLAIRRQLEAYDRAHPGQIVSIAAVNRSKIPLIDLQSQRRPDLAVYRNLTPDEVDFWGYWIPELVIEVVTPEPAHRDYFEKPEEYLQFGVMEYWIVDAERQEMLALWRRAGKWAERIVRPPEMYRSKSLGGFTLDCGAALATTRQTAFPNEVRQQ